MGEWEDIGPEDVGWQARQQEGSQKPLPGGPRRRKELQSLANHIFNRSRFGAEKDGVKRIGLSISDKKVDVGLGEMPRFHPQKKGKILLPQPSGKLLV